MIAHAGLIARRERGLWSGVLITGPSGAGKSDLALRAIAGEFRLLADDRTVLFTSGGRLFGRAADPLRGYLEARGVGIVRQDGPPVAPVSLMVRCKPAPEAVERLQEGQWEEILGVRIPALDIHPLEFSAPAKLSRALDQLGAGPRRGYQARFASSGQGAGA